MTWIVIGIAAALIGLSVGAVGIGGPIVVPVLVFAGGFSLHEAMATAMASFVVLGTAWAVLYWRRGSASLATNLAVAVAGIPAQYAGARIAAVSDAALITLWLAGALMALGLLAWRAPRVAINGVVETGGSRGRLFTFGAVGAVAGLANGMISSGGGMFGVPLLLAAGYAPIAAISSMLLLSAGGTLAGAAGWIGTGLIHWPTAAVLTVFLVMGCALGVAIAHRIPALVLRRVAAAICMFMGVVLLQR